MTPVCHIRWPRARGSRRAFFTRFFRPSRSVTGRRSRRVWSGCRGRVAEAARRARTRGLSESASGLVALLGFFDDEPSWACLLVLETPVGGAVTFECTQRLHSLLAGLLERTPDVTDGCGASRAGGSPVLLAMLTGRAGRRWRLLGHPHEHAGRRWRQAGGAGTVVDGVHRCAISRSSRRAGRAGGEAVARGGGVRGRVQPRAGGSDIPGGRASGSCDASHDAGAARDRTRPYSNNREIARGRGCSDEGQTSKLLARLERQGVIENVGLGALRGEPNAWVLTVGASRGRADR